MTKPRGLKKSSKATKAAKTTSVNEFEELKHTLHEVDFGDDEILIAFLPRFIHKCFNLSFKESKDCVNNPEFYDLYAWALGEHAGHLSRGEIEGEVEKEYLKAYSLALEIVDRGLEIAKDDESLLQRKCFLLMDELSSRLCFQDFDDGQEPEAVIVSTFESYRQFLRRQSEESAIDTIDKLVAFFDCSPEFLDLYLEEVKKTIAAMMETHDVVDGKQKAKYMMLEAKAELEYANSKADAVFSDYDDSDADEEDDGEEEDIGDDWEDDEICFDQDDDDDDEDEEEEEEVEENSDEEDIDSGDEENIEHRYKLDAPEMADLKRDLKTRVQKSIDLLTEAFKLDEAQKTDDAGLLLSEAVMRMDALADDEEEAEKIRMMGIEMFKKCSLKIPDDEDEYWQLNTDVKEE